MATICVTVTTLRSRRTEILEVARKHGARNVRVFGSVARGDSGPDSDVDLFVLVKNNHDKEQLGPFIEKASDACFEVYGNRFVPYILTEKEARQKKGLKLLSEIETGTRII